MKAIQYPYGLKGTQQANTCPFCGSQGSVSLENQELEILLDDKNLRIINGFECFNCADSWWQTIEVQLGEATKNIVEVH